MSDPAAPTTDRAAPTSEQAKELLHYKRNWGRWGDDDQRGTVNLITPEKVVQAVQLVKNGRQISMARDFPTDQGPHNWNPAEQWWKWFPKEFGGGFGFDFIALNCHGVTCTHLDAICHTWDDEGMYNGRAASDHTHSHGASFGGIEHWATGIVTRGVLLDVPRHRGTPYVTVEEPVHGWELEDILVERDIELRAGDALVVYSGRDAWQADNPDKPYFRWKRADGQIESPGLNASCLPFVRDHDIGILVWDMLDANPDAHDLGVPYTMHAVGYMYGLPLLDNCQLEGLAQACQEEGRDDFLFITLPLLMTGATGSPVNPIAIF